MFGSKVVTIKEILLSSISLHLVLSITRLNSAFVTRPSPFLSYPRKAAFTLAQEMSNMNIYLQEFLVLHKRHFGEVVVVLLSDDQVVLTQGLGCIKNLNPE